MEKLREQLNLRVNTMSIPPVWYPARADTAVRITIPSKARSTNLQTRIVNTQTRSDALLMPGTQTRLDLNPLPNLAHCQLYIAQIKGLLNTIDQAGTVIDGTGLPPNRLLALPAKTTVTAVRTGQRYLLEALGGSRFRTNEPGLRVGELLFLADGPVGYQGMVQDTDDLVLTVSFNEDPVYRKGNMVDAYLMM